MIRKVLASAGLLAIVGGTLVGCGANGEGGGDGAGDSETLTIWGWRGDAPWIDLMESYSAPGITVEYKSFKAEEYNTALQTGLSSSSGPDAMLLRSYGGLETLVSGGQVAALEESFPGLANIPDNLIDGARSRADGEIYGVPFQSVTMNMFYNTDIFEEHDIEVPETWSDFVDACEKLKDAGVIPLAAGANSSWILPLYRDMFGASEYGGPAFAEALLSGEATFEDPDYAAANQVLLDLAPFLPDGYTGISNTDATALFTSGQAAMRPGGIWELAEYQQTAPDLKLGLFNPPPTTGNEPFAVGYLDGAIGMNAALEGEEKEKAEAFLEWVGSEEFATKIADEVLSIPAVTGVTPSDPLLAEATTQFEQHPTPYLTYVHFDYGTPSGTSLEYDNLQKMMLGQITPEEVGTALQQGISQWFTAGNG